MLRIAIYQHSGQPLSICNYAASICRELEEIGVRFTPFDDDTPLPTDVDLYWDPSPAGGYPPSWKLLAAMKPFVATVHGAAPMAMPAREYSRSSLGSARYMLRNSINLWKWRRFRERCAAIITVSIYAKNEIVRYLHLPAGKVTPIYHAADTTLFRPSTPSAASPPYLLHVSQYQPKKNIGRLLSAYASCRVEHKPRLVAIIPGYPEQPAPAGVEIFRAALNHDELSHWYAGALAFVFPSLHETFGMPIVEAMACGCPVITSKTTACSEVAGDAALLVDPRSVPELAEAMQHLTDDAALRDDLRQRGLARAAEFSWRKSAEQHLMVFEGVLRAQATS